MPAIAAYIRQLRDAQDISRDRLGEMVGTAGNNIWRIEEQGQEPRGGLLILVIQALKGSFDDAVVLLRDDADEADGRRLAMARLSHEQRSHIAAFREDPANYSAVSLAQKVEKDPDLRRAFIQIVDALRDQEDSEPKE